MRLEHYFKSKLKRRAKKYSRTSRVFWVILGIICSRESSELAQLKTDVLGEKQKITVLLQAINKRTTSVGLTENIKKDMKLAIQFKPISIKNDQTNNKMRSQQLQDLYKCKHYI